MTQNDEERVGAERDAAGHDATGHDAAGHDAAAHEAPGHDAAARDAAGRDAGERDAAEAAPAHGAPDAWSPPTAAREPEATTAPVYASFPPPSAPAPPYSAYAPPPAPPAPAYAAYPPPPATPSYAGYAPPAATPSHAGYAPPAAVPGYAPYPPQTSAPGYAAYPPPAGAPSYGYGAYPAVAGGQPVEQWSAPVKPGLIPLRPLSFGNLLGAPFQVLRRNPGPTVGSALIIQFAIGVITALIVGAAALFAFNRVQSASAADYDSISAGSVAIILLSTLIPLAFALVSSALLQSILVIEVSREVLGEKRRMGELWRAAGKRIWPLALWTLLQAAVVVVVLAVVIGVIVLLSMLGGAGAVAAVIVGIFSFLGLAVLAAWLTTKLSLVPCAIVLERVGVRAAIVRSWRLTDRAFWKTLGTEWLVAVILYFATQLVVQPISLLSGLGIGIFAPNGTSSSNPTSELWLLGGVYLVVIVVQIVFGAISSVVQAATVSVIYVDRRIRSEGLDLELIRFVEARENGTTSPDDDPFRVPGRA